MAATPTPARPTGHGGPVLVRRLLAVVLLLMASVSVATLAGGLWAQVSFEPTDAARFQAWAARPAVTAGIGALACCVGGFAGLVMSRHRRPRAMAGPVLAALLAATALVWGHAVRHARSHPESARARALTALRMPDGYLPSAITIEHPSSVTEPGAVRTWSVPLGRVPCTDLQNSLSVWADPDSVRAAPGSSAARCFFAASWHRHRVDANVGAGPAGSASVFVRLAG